METGTIMAYMSIVSMLAVVFLALFDGRLLPSQQPGKKWIPVIANGAIWGNLIIMSGVLYFIGRYTDQFSKTEITFWLIVGMAISWLSYFLVYQHGKYYKDDGLSHPLSIAGVVFFLYGGAVYGAIFMFYVCSHPAFEDVILVSVLLALYIPIANHVLLYFMDPFFFPWCPDIFAEESSPMRSIIGGEIVIAVATIIKIWTL